MGVGASSGPSVRRRGAAAPRFAYKLAPAVVVGGAAAVDLTAMVEDYAGGGEGGGGGGGKGKRS
jgi:hypothetical protein